ncbi:unnamed protein product [Symbiodinium microadriaticum]|nr:unnamed protein product [Symbiodinium microadriaticum]
MVTVDLSQAFDKMPRKLLLQGMIDLQLPADLIAIVMAWHAHIHYTVHHSGESRTFAATQGIRQGCSASPILWLIFSHAISSRLEESLGYERLCSLLTIFADDYLAAGVFTTLHELEQLLSCVTVLFKVLRTFGMAVSDTKSQAIIALRGTLDATLAFRMQKSDAMYGRLGTALRGRHHLTSAQRHPPSVPPTLAVVLPASTVVLVLPSRDYTSSPVRSFGSSASASKPSMESTAMDQEIKEVFGNLAQNNMTQFGEALFGGSQSSTPGSEPPSKAPKLEAQMGKRGRAPDNPSSRGQKDQDWAPTKGRGKGNKTSPQIHQLVHAMGRLIIRQETQLQILKQNSAWNLYLQPGQAGPVALLCQAAAKYREEAKTRFMEVLVRALLLHTLFQALLKALQSISGDSNKQQILKDKGWLNAEGNWNYQQWDGEQQALKVNEAKPPMGHQDLIGRVGQLTELVLGKDVIHRFNATHTLTPNKTGVATFLLEVGLRAQGVETTWNTLELLAGLSALQVIGLQIRREGLRRGGLANDVQKLLYASAGWCCTILPTSVTLTLWLMLICGVIIGWRLASWKHLLRGWRQPDAQHDVADFLSHILSIMQPPQLQARWEARLATMQGTACEDNGTLHTPIVLHIHSTHVTLQDCINAWHQQVRPHALVAVPGLLFVQLARYRCTGSLTFKNRQSVVIPSQVTIPVFGRGIQIFNATFHTAAVISHHGAHTCTGHYTTLLFPNAADDRGHYWGTDDDRQAQLSESMPKHVQHDGYIVALIRRH